MPLAPRRQLLHMPLRPAGFGECLQRIHEFENLVGSEPADPTLENLPEKVLHEILHLKGQVTQAQQFNRPMNDLAIAQEIGDIRRRYLQSRSQFNSLVYTRTPSLEESDSATD